MAVRDIFIIFLFVVGSAVAQPKASTETLDVTTFKPPAGWTRDAKPDSIQFTITNNKAGAGASLAIVRSIPSVGDARANFDKAWEHFVTPLLPDAPPPSVAPITTRDGWQLVRGTTAHTFEGRSGTTIVVTATREQSYVIVVATMIGTTYSKDVDAVLASLRFAGSAPVAQPAIELSGAWGFSTGGAMGTGQFAAWLSDRREYMFDGKGTYTFLRRHNVDREPDTSIIRERGTYSLAGDVLTLTPAKSEREIWSKVMSGPSSGAYAKLLRREKVALEKTSYRVSYTVYPDTQVPNLMLTPSAATSRDGGFNATTQYRLFRPDNKYYTPVPPTP